VVNSDLVIDFVNTLDLHPYQERLDSPRALVVWLSERGLIAPELVNRQGFAHSMPRLPRQFHAPFADGADLPPAPSAIPAGSVVGGLGG